MQAIENLNPAVPSSWNQKPAAAKGDRIMQPTRTRTLVTLATLITLLGLAGYLAAPAAAATIYKIDIDSTEETNSVDTEDGYTSLLASTTTSVTVEGVTFTKTGMQGDRNRNDQATDLLTDFLYNENGGDVGLQISGLPEGPWEAEVWSFDAGGNSFEEAKNQNVGVKDGSTRTVFVSGFDDNDQNPATFQFNTADFLNGDITIFTQGTEGTNNKKRGRFNGLVLTAIPEPTTALLLALGGLALLRRPRRRK